MVRRNNCIYRALGTCYSVWMTVWYAGSSMQNNKYQVSHKYSCFCWWWAHSRPKHVEKRNKHNKKNCAPSWLYLQDYTGMHGQQNVKFFSFIWPVSVATIFFGIVYHVNMAHSTECARNMQWGSGRKWHTIDVAEIRTLYLVITVVTVLLPFYCHIGNRKETQELLHTVNFMER